ncbi:MAG: hypothetical protein AAGC81_05705 [Pseudomonadota bacterium]
MDLRFLTILICAAVLAGCAVGNKYDYRAGTAKLPPTANSIAIGVVDTRAYVLSGDTSPRFVGFQQDGYGNAFEVTTTSGAPLSNDFAKALSTSFARGGATVDLAPIAPGTPVSEGVQSLQGLGTDRVLLLEMREWKTDVLADIKVHWNLTARVYDGSGRLLADENSQGIEGTGHLGDILGTEKAQLAVGEASRRLSELLSRPTITSALQ